MTITMKYKRYLLLAGALLLISCFTLVFIVRAAQTTERMSQILALAGIGVVFMGMLLCLWLLYRQRRLDAALLHAAYTDGLTGLCNAKGFEVRARALLDQNEQHYFLLDCGINHFDSFNLLHGTARGDEILLAVAEMMKKSHDAQELCARIYGGHFLCLFHAPTMERALERVAEEEALFKRFVSDKLLFMSYGLFEIQDRSLPVQQMIDCAAAARRSNKEDRLKTIDTYNKALHWQRIQENELVAEVETALAGGEFVALYQPKSSIETEELVGAEALVRWFLPSGECPPPDYFIPLLERSGLIAKLDMFMLETVCAHLRAWLDQGVEPVPVSVNFSRAHIHNPRFAEQVREVLSRYSLPPYLVEAEFTETAVIEDVEQLFPVMEKLHAMGLLVTMDDFGSGYSSLNMLCTMPLDVIKLDKAFMEHIETDDRSKTLLVGILQLTKALELITVAEGVESREQLDFLRENGCDVVQGYYFSKPISGESFTGLMEKSRQTKGA